MGLPGKPFAHGKGRPQGLDRLSAFFLPAGVAPGSCHSSHFKSPPESTPTNNTGLAYGCGRCIELGHKWVENVGPLVKW